jgi:transcription initiation factor TFIIIB Brf1 subunit/transcription initiation factor TFIIB
MILNSTSPEQKIPDNIDELYDDLQKVMRIVDSASEPSHFDVALSMLHNLSNNKWLLNSKVYENPVYSAVYARISRKRNELHAEINS